MLTTLEANFVQEYKNCGSPTRALRLAGSKASEKSMPVLAYRMIRKPEIKKLLDDYAVNLVNEVAKPVLSSVNPMITNVNPIKVINLPTKEEYIETAWKRQSDDSNLKPDLKHKYFETAGKTLGLLGREDGPQENNTFQIVCKEMNFSIAPSADTKAKLLAELAQAEAEAVTRTQSIVSPTDVIDITEKNKHE